MTVWLCGMWILACNCVVCGCVLYDCMACKSRVVHDLCCMMCEVWLCIIWCLVVCCVIVCCVILWCLCDCIFMTVSYDCVVWHVVVCYVLIDGYVVVCCMVELCGLYCTVCGIQLHCCLSCVLCGHQRLEEMGHSSFKKRCYQDPDKPYPNEAGVSVHQEPLGLCWQVEHYAPWHVLSPKCQSQGFFSKAGSIPEHVCVHESCQPMLPPGRLPPVCSLPRLFVLSAP